MEHKEKYRTLEICQFDYSDIWEKSFDENYTDKPLRNDEIIKLLNEQEKWIERLEKENSDLKVLVKDLAKKGEQINDIRLDWNQDYREFNKDTLYIEDHNTKIKLKDGRLYIEVFIPKINEYFRFNYIVTGRKLEREYNIIKGDCDD